MFLWLVFAIDGLALRQHAPMQDARNENAAGLLPVKHDVTTVLHTTQARANILTSPTQSGIAGQPPATILKLGDVTVCLGFAPSAKGINADAEQVGPGTTRETKRGHS
jgi:hypothetical protein